AAQPGVGVARDGRPSAGPAGRAGDVASAQPPAGPVGPRRDVDQPRSGPGRLRGGRGRGAAPPVPRTRRRATRLRRDHVRGAAVRRYPDIAVPVTHAAAPRAAAAATATGRGAVAAGTARRRAGVPDGHAVLPEAAVLILSRTLLGSDAKRP